MTELLIFTLLATIVALYTVLPEHRRVRANFILRKPRWQIWIILLLSVIISMYIADQYIQVATEENPQKVYNIIPFHPTKFEFKTRFPLILSQILTSIILVLSVGTVFFTTMADSGEENYLTAKIRECFNREDYGVLTDIISDNYDMLLHDESTAVPGAASRVRDYLLESNFAETHPNIAPELGVRIIEDDRVDLGFKKDFTGEFLNTQVRTDNSLLRRELRENQIVENHWKYPIQDENEILSAILTDLSKAEDLVVYNAVGTPVTDILREHRYMDYDLYHEPRLSPGTEAFNDPVYTGIRFIHLLMVRAIEEDSDHHMGLTELMSINRAVCNNYDLTPASDPGSEWPNDYAFFIYSIFEALTDWIRIVEYEYENPSQYSIELSSISNEWTGSVVKSAVVCLFLCHKEVLTCSDISDEYKDYISMMVFRQWLSLREYDVTELPYWYSKLMAKCLEENLGTTTKSRNYHSELKSVFQRQQTEIRIKDRQMTGFVSELQSIIY